MPDEFTRGIAYQAGLARPQGGISGQTETVEDITAFAHERFSIFVDMNHGWPR
jgi:hypothetical protein